MILDKILEHKRREVKDRKNARYLADLKTKIRDAPAPIDFYQALAGPPRSTTSLTVSSPRLIAEVKKASPSRGVLCEDFDPLKIAQTYHEHGAAALSVLTDREFFQGSLDHLRAIREKVPLPALNKEFMVDELQFYEARAHLADAVLLIVAALDRVQLVDFYHLARQELGLVLERLCEARIIGINNRDLTTFVTTLDVTLRLAKRIPGNKLIVSESGIFTRNDVKRVVEAGVRAVLVGESLMTAKDVGAKMKELIGPRAEE